MFRAHQADWLLHQIWGCLSNHRQTMLSQGLCCMENYLKIKAANSRITLGIRPVSGPGFPFFCYCLHFYQSCKKSHQFVNWENLFFCSFPYLWQQQLHSSCFSEKSSWPFSSHPTCNTWDPISSTFKTCPESDHFSPPHCYHPGLGGHPPDPITARATYLISLLCCLCLSSVLFFLAMLCSMWDLSSLTRDWIWVPYIPALEAQS